MIKALLFLVKIAVLVFIAVWIADQPGSVTFDWIDADGNDMKVKMPVGIFSVGALVVMLLALFLYRVIRFFADFPKTWKRYRYEINREKGYKALTLGLTAVAAGDAKVANYQAFRAETMMANDNGLPMLLKAQACRMQGKEDEARDSFVKMLGNKDAAFIGMRGLLQSALDDKHYEQALEIAQKAIESYPKQGWLLQIAYDLEIKSRDFESALSTLKKAEKAGVFTKEKAQSDAVAMLLHEADIDLNENDYKNATKKLEKAYKIDPTFIPSVLKLSKLYVQQGKKKKASNLIEKAWFVNTHPDLVSLWDASMTSKSNDPVARLRRFEKLLALDPRSSEGQMAVARVSMDNGLWGEARNYLVMAESIRPSARLYRLFADLEERSGKDEASIRHWLELASEAPANKTWVCRKTGLTYNQWSAFAQPHDSFNTIFWDLPQNLNEIELVIEPQRDAAQILEAPKA